MNNILKRLWSWLALNGLTMITINSSSLLTHDYEGRNNQPIWSCEHSLRVASGAVGDDWLASIYAWLILRDIDQSEGR